MTTQQLLDTQILLNNKIEFYKDTANIERELKETLRRLELVIEARFNAEDRN